MITLALIGVGRWGLKILKESKSVPGIRIKYVCSPNISEKRLDKNYIKEKQYQDLIYKKDIDGFIIATPPDTHFEISKFFIKSSKNILIEKPFALSVQEAEELFRISKKSKSKIKISHIYLRNPAFKKLLQLVGNNGLYEIKIYLGNKEKRKVDSPLWEWGPHAISMIIPILPGEPGQILINMNDSQKIDAALIYKTIRVRIVLGWGFLENKRSFEIKGKNFSAIFDDRASRKVCIKKGSKMIYPKFSEKSALHEELLEFKRAIKDNERTDSDLKDGVLVTRILESIQNKQIIA